MNYHDMLAYLGIGSAHPGGFAATLNFLAHFPVEPGSKVLEVGCGTGKTACHLAKNGCNVTGLDIRPHMLQKAKKRAEKEGVQVTWVEGDIRSLPFESESFDVVIGESITVFVRMASALREYHRVLRKGGRLFDREMMAIRPIPEGMKQAIRELYGAFHMPQLEDWLGQLRSAGFQEVEVWKPTALCDDIYHFINMEDDEFCTEDVSSEEMTEMQKIKMQNQQIMEQYQKYHGYGVFIGKKP